MRAAVHRQAHPGELVVVTDRIMLKRLAALVTYRKFMKDAAAVVVVVGDADNKHAVEDCVAATENILPASFAHGVGSCWVAGYNQDYNAACARLLGIPAEKEIFSFISFGYYGTLPRAPAKRPVEDIIRWERY
ncbi:nitroreductase family protein [Candidatus Woesearchaeota archaeon]|nr:nitroreductase family protein [Candidatus Woesearchaeota archaeon]